MFLADGDSKTVTVVDSRTDTVLANIDAGGGLEYAVVGDDGKVYVNGAEKKEIVRIDIATNKVDAHWPIPGCTSPHGLAIDTAGHRLFPTCVNKVMTVVDTASGAVVATLPIGQGTDAAAFDPVRKRAFSSNGEGTVTVIDAKDPSKPVVLETVPTRVTGRTMAIDPASGRLFVAAAEIDPKAPVPRRPERPPRASAPCCRLAETDVPGPRPLRAIMPPARRLPSTKRLSQSAMAAALFLSACQVGPNFQAPAPSQAAGYAPGGLPTAIAPDQRLTAGGDVPARWWEAYGSPS